MGPFCCTCWPDRGVAWQAGAVAWRAGDCWNFSGAWDGFGLPALKVGFLKYVDIILIFFYCSMAWILESHPLRKITILGNLELGFPLKFSYNIN